MIELLDYLLDYDDNFWVVNEIDEVSPKGYIVYYVDDNGDRYNSITKKHYRKNNKQELIPIPKIKRIFKPNAFFLNNKDKIEGVWKKYVEVLNKIGIKDQDIGIFGSLLIGFEIIKDVDFIIYGIDNLYKYYENNDFIKNYIGASYITPSHIKHQYEKHKNLYPQKCDLLEIISRNWSGVQIKEGVLSTPRFIDRENMLTPIINSELETITCRVISSIESNLFPRRGKVIFENEEYTIMTNRWKFQSFLRDDDIIECLGRVDRQKKVITLNDKDSYIRYLNK